MGIKTQEKPKECKIAGVICWNFKVFIVLKVFRDYKDFKDLMDFEVVRVFRSLSRFGARSRGPFVASGRRRRLACPRCSC